MELFIHVFMHLYGGEKPGMVKVINSCGTLIGVRIIPLKVDQILTGIIRTYINILGRGQ